MSSQLPPTLQVTVNRVEYASGAVLQMLALPLVLLLLAAHALGTQRVLVTKRGLAGSLLVYLAASLAFLVPTLAYSIFMVYSTWIGPPGVQYNIQWLFWTGVWTVAATCSIANATLFLTLDRCLIILCPLKYPKRIYQRMLIGFDLLSTMIIYIGSMVMVLVQELPLDPETAPNCLNHLCTVSKYHYGYHVLFTIGQGLLNLLFGIIFLCLLRYKTPTVSNDALSKNTRKNRIVLMTILSEIVLKILPGIAAYMVYTFTSLLLSNYLGWYIMFLSSVDTFLVSVYYSAVLIKWPELIRLAMAKFGLTLAESTNLTQHNGTKIRTMPVQNLQEN